MLCFQFRNKITGEASFTEAQYDQSNFDISALNNRATNLAARIKLVK
jgi:hypothetical protein